MAKQTLTQWFPADVKPVHVGVYETAEGDGDGRCFAYWDGWQFCYRAWENFFPCAVNAAFFNQDGPTGMPRFVSWRGLAVKP